MTAGETVGRSRPCDSCGYLDDSGVILQSNSSLLGSADMWRGSGTRTKSQWQTGDGKAPLSLYVCRAEQYRGRCVSRCTSPICVGCPNGVCRTSNTAFEVPSTFPHRALGKVFNRVHILFRRERIGFAKIDIFSARILQNEGKDRCLPHLFTACGKVMWKSGKPGCIRRIPKIRSM